MPAFEEISAPLLSDALLGEFGGSFGLAKIADLLSVGGFASEVEVAALRAAMQIVAGDGTITLTGLSAGSTVALVVFGSGGASAPLVVKAGATTLRTVTFPAFVQSIGVAFNPDSGSVVSVVPGLAVPPFAQALSFTATKGGDVTFTATGPGAVSLLAIRLK